MAFSSTRISQNITGVKKEHIYSWNSAGVTTGTIKTGFSVIEHVTVNNLVTADKPGKAVPSGGDVVMSGLVSNDTGTICIKGY